MKQVETMQSTSCGMDDSDADFFIDITEEICPITFVRTRLLLERMASGQTADIRLSGAEPLANVPRALTLQGHQVIALEAETRAAAEAPDVGPHRLRVRKK